MSKAKKLSGDSMEKLSVSSVGQGVSIVKDKVGDDIRFKSIEAGESIVVEEKDNSVVISSKNNEKQIIKAGENIKIDQKGNEVTISADKYSPEPRRYNHRNIDSHMEDGAYHFKQEDIDLERIKERSKDVFKQYLTLERHNDIYNNPHETTLSQVIQKEKDAQFTVKDINRLVGHKHKLSEIEIDKKLLDKESVVKIIESTSLTQMKDFDDRKFRDWTQKDVGLIDPSNLNLPFVDSHDHLKDKGKNSHAEIDSHIEKYKNPHGPTVEQENLKITKNLVLPLRNSTNPEQVGAFSYDQARDALCFNNFQEPSVYARSTKELCFRAIPVVGDNWVCQLPEQVGWQPSIIRLYALGDGQAEAHCYFDVRGESAPNRSGEALTGDIKVLPSGVAITDFKFKQIKKKQHLFFCLTEVDEHVLEIIIKIEYKEI